MFSVKRALLAKGSLAHRVVKLLWLGLWLMAHTPGYVLVLCSFRRIYSRLLAIAVTAVLLCHRITAELAYENSTVQYCTIQYSLVQYIVCSI